MKLINDRLPKSKPYEIKRTPKAHDMDGYEAFAESQEESANAPVRANNNINNNEQPSDNNNNNNANNEMANRPADGQSNNQVPANYQDDYPRIIDMMLDMNMDDVLENESIVEPNQDNNLPIVQTVAQPVVQHLNQPGIYNTSDNIECMSIEDNDDMDILSDSSEGVTNSDDYFGSSEYEYDL